MVDARFPIVDRQEHATEACRQAGVHIYRSRDLLPDQV